MINQTIKYSMILSAVFAAILGSVQSDANALALLAGTAWGCANLYFISMVSHSYLITQKHLQTILLLTLKFPILYWVGFELLRLKIWSPLALCAGFGIVFLGIAGSSYRQFTKRPV